MNVFRASRASLLSLPRDALLFLAASFINSTGKAVMWPLTVLYMHNVMGKSYGEAGLIVLYQAVFGVLGEFAGGNLYYRVGPKAMIAGSFTISSLCLFGIAATDAWPVYIALVCALGFFNGISLPSMNAYVGFRWKAYRRKLYNVMYVCNNFGLSIGAMAGGLVASISFSLTYLLTACTTLLFAAFLVFFMKRQRPAAGEEDGPGLEPSANPAGPIEMNRRALMRRFRLYLFLAFGSLFFWFSFTQWATGVAPYIEEKGLDLKYYSLLWSINGVVILCGQPLTGWIKRRFTQELPSQMVASALFSVTAFAFILFFHESYVYLAIGMVLATFGEMLLLPAIPTFFSERSGAYAPFYMGLAGGFANIGRMVGPLIFGHLFDLWGIASVFLVGTLASMAGLAMFLIHHTVNKDRGHLREAKLSASAR